MKYNRITAKPEYPLCLIADNCKYTCGERHNVLCSSRMHVCVCIYICMCMYVYIYIYIYMYMYVYMCMRVYTLHS